MATAQHQIFPNQSQLVLDFPIDHYDMLHHDQRGVVIHWQKKASGSIWKKLAAGDPDISRVLRADRGRRNRYITVNEFDGWRLIRLLRSLRALYIDLDDQTDLEAVLDFLLAARIPAPSFAVYSGTGLHLYWALVPLPPKALPVWQLCQDDLIKALKPLGADPACRDCTRVLRLVGTKNERVEVRGTVISGRQWALRDIVREITGREGQGEKPSEAEIRDIRAHKKHRPRNMQGNIYARWNLVYRDLLAIAGHHGNSIPEGYRDKWVFLTATALSWFTHPEGIENEIVGLGLKNTGLSEREVRGAIGTAVARATQACDGKKLIWHGQEVDPRYRFRRQTLYDWLGDIIPAALLPSLRAIIPDEEHRKRETARLAALEEKRDRAAEGRYATSYTLDGVRAGNEQNRATARLMRAQGLTQREIAEALGVAQSTVSEWVKG